LTYQTWTASPSSAACLPDLQQGGWLLFENMGAYTVAASSNFNGFATPDIHYVMSRPAW
jgi:diaminopimelate decarboxylase